MSVIGSLAFLLICGLGVMSVAMSFLAARGHR